MSEPKNPAEKLFNDAAGPMRYPAWLYIGGQGLKGGGDRLVACFLPCTVKHEYGLSLHL